MRPPAEDHLATAARSALLDHAAVAAVRQLRDGGIRAILLKGASIASWLYAGDEVRPYIDFDLLVAPADVDATLAALRRLDYRHVLAGAAPVEIGAGWQNELALQGPHGVFIDLHHRLIGVPSSQQCWDVLSAHTAPLRLASGVVETLDLPARTMHLALHAAQSGAADSQALTDLARGLDRLDPTLWGDAAELAESLDATAAFAAGLRLLPQGRELAERWSLPDDMGVELAVRVAGRSQDALFFERLADRPGVRAKVGWVAREAFPTTVFLRDASRLARRGGWGMAVARLWRPVSLLLRFVPAAGTWLRARRMLRRRRTRTSAPRPRIR